MQSNPQAQIWTIDDEPDVVASMGGVLEDAGFRYRGFTDPREVLRALEDVEAPDLFIVDLNMPHMTGAEVIRELRARSELMTTPIIVVTALSSESSTLNALEAGADDVLRKPVSTAELLARISGQLSRSERLAQLRRQNRDLKLVTELAKVLSQETQLPDILRALVDGLRSALNVERAAIYLRHESGELHRALPADPSRSEGSPNIRLDVGRVPAVREALDARRAALLDADQTRTLLEAVGGSAPTQLETSSAAVLPMLDRGALVGVIVLVAERPAVGSSPREQFLSSIISNFAAVAVHRAESLEALREDNRAIDEANRELHKTRDFLQNVILSSPDAIVASNVAGEIVLYNHAAERILGWKQSEALGRDVRMLYPSGGAERIMQRLRSEGHGGPGRLEPMREIVVDREGREIPVEISAAIVYEDGKESATVGIFTDLRGRLRMEEQLQEVTENLERSRRQAVAAELAGAAAHELNQPLTSLLGYAELLSTKLAPDDEHYRAVDTIHRDAERIADIVKKIGKITDYRTKEYVGGARIVDLDRATDQDASEPSSPSEGE